MRVSHFFPPTEESLLPLSAASDSVIHYGYSASRLPERRSARLRNSFWENWVISELSSQQMLLARDQEANPKHSCWSTGCQPTHHKLGFHPLILFSLHVLLKYLRNFHLIKDCCAENREFGRLKCAMRHSWKVCFSGWNTQNISAQYHM